MIFQGLFRKALENLNHDQWSPDAAMAVSWLDCRNGGFSRAFLAVEYIQADRHVYCRRGLAKDAT
jgi:hypothetical protein